MFASAVEKRQPTNSRKDSGNTGFPRKAFTQKYGSECFRLFDRYRETITRSLGKAEGLKI